MTLGGGTWITQNKVLPGSYINFVSTNTTGATLSDRGVCAAPLSIGWGASDEIIDVTAEDFQKKCINIFGYDYTDEEMKPYRDLFINASECYFYRTSGGNKASADFATARCEGTRGNSIFYTIAQNVDNEDYYDVCTYVRSVDSTVESNKEYDFASTKTISEDIVNVNDKATIDTSDGEYYCIFDGAREGTDFDTDGTPNNRALGFVSLTVPCQVKVTCKTSTVAGYVRIFTKGTSTATLTPTVSGTTATFTISAGSDATKDIYIYGTDKLYISKIEIVYDGAVSDTLVDKQTVKGTTTNLADNDFVVWIDGETLTETAGTFLTGGTDTSATGTAYQNFLNAIEGVTFNTLVCDSTNDTIKALFANFTERMRDEVGAKFQTVVYNYAADYEGVINLTTAASEDTAALVWWLAGAEAGCEISKSCTNKKYDGEYTPVCTETQSELENAINNGELKFHRVGSDYRILSDIDSLVTTTTEKGDLFKANQTIRVCDQIAMDIATLFNTNYLGIMPNDKAGRTALWGDIVKYMKELETLRAIEDFTDTDVTVEQGETKKSVVVYAPITVVNTMEQLYMTVYVS